MLSALMPVCNPPLRQHQSKSGPPPPWWPTGFEDWWATELLAHLDTVAALMGAPAPVPFAPSYSLKKAQKVAVLVAIVKHLAPDFACVAAAVRHSGKLSVSETDLWHSALNNELAKCMRPMFIVLPQQQGGVAIGGGSASTDPSAAGSVVVHSGNAASDGCELPVANVNLPAGASVSAPADGSRGEVIAAAELQVEKEQRSDIHGVGVVSATDADAPAGDGRDQPVNFPAAGGDDGSTHKQGAAVAAAPTTGHVRQVPAGGPEMTMQPEQDGGVPGDDVAAAAEDEQQVHPVVAPNPTAVAAIEEAPEDRHWWCNSEELNRMFAEFESFGDDVWY
jgi:ethylene-insensitive protein 3